MQIIKEGFRYLGIFITTDPKLRYERNLLPPLQRLKRDVAAWKTLPLSLLGRAALFKMMSLPHFLYALQNSTDLVPARYFSEIETRPWIALRKLVLGWYDGGIGLPDIKRYYWAAHLAAINHCTYRHEDDPGV